MASVANAVMPLRASAIFKGRRNPLKHHTQRSSYRPFSSRDALFDQQSRPSSNASKTESSGASRKSSLDSSGLTYSTETLKPFYTERDPLDKGEWTQDPGLTIRKSYQSNQYMQLHNDFNRTLLEVARAFDGVRYVFAYGSGVFPQSSASASTSSKKVVHPDAPEAVLKWQRGGGKMIDFIFGVSLTQHFHSLNLRKHRDHYSGIGSLGSGFVSAVQDKWGAGAYFNPYVVSNGLMIKYGVVNIDTLEYDLANWSSLFFAGRMHKPVKIARDDKNIAHAVQFNLLSAVRTALLMLPETFSERDLYSTIASISYLGDPRMSIGAEAPDKIKNIVENQLPSFRRLYQVHLTDLPNLNYKDGHADLVSDEWHADTKINRRLVQDMGTQRRANMLRRLPQDFRHKVYFVYQSKFGIPRGEFDDLMEATNDRDQEATRKQEGGDFERRIAKESDIKDKMGEAIKLTVRWPSAMQALKGPLTAGLSKSWKYAMDKRQKGKVKSQ